MRDDVIRRSAQPPLPGDRLRHPTKGGRRTTRFGQDLTSRGRQAEREYALDHPVPVGRPRKR
jgi:hypothetical protein